MSAEIPTPILHAARTRLRPLKIADSTAMTTMASDFDVARMTTSIPHPFSTEVALDFIERMMAADLERDRAFGIETRDGDFAGVLGFHHRDGPAPEMGYWLGRPFWGQGLMTETARTALEWARDVWGKDYLVSGHFADNPASGRVLCKAGFLYTGDVVLRHSVARGEAAMTRMMSWGA